MHVKVKLTHTEAEACLASMTETVFSYSAYQQDQEFLAPSRMGYSTPQVEGE